jgi:DNA polymerase
MGRPFEGREGRLLKKLLREAGLADVYLTLAVKCLPIPAKAVYQCNINACKTWLWKELQAVAPRVVVTLGPIPTRLLLKLKSSFRMQDVVGQFHDVPFMSALVAPWYSPRWVLSHGSKADKQAVEFFKQVKEKSDGAGES